jgi:hypothetical protein
MRWVIPLGRIAGIPIGVNWTWLPIVALVICILNPAAARDVVGSLERWAREHSRTILIWVSLAAGVVLVVRGALTV